MKKVSFAPKPSTTSKSSTADDWVLSRQRPAEPIKRLTIDIPLSLHRRVKAQCAVQGLQMAVIVREWLERRFPPNEEPATQQTVSPGHTETQKIVNADSPQPTGLENPDSATTTLHSQTP